MHDFTSLSYLEYANLEGESRVVVVGPRGMEERSGNSMSIEFQSCQIKSSRAMLYSSMHIASNTTF